MRKKKNTRIKNLPHQTLSKGNFYLHSNPRELQLPSSNPNCPESIRENGWSSIFFQIQDGTLNKYQQLAVFIVHGRNSA
ncbi:hypothetical protein TSUD_201780 [Trifolium subterraneum]|uniref:Uncharacterized protein n=1 Tax=Trifolium subterraneum TaxID=3900 RepID=A0A2Z6M081_TRISU|nr:hypothetical protein TSUD_201780 [Trifolium subterraneum]